MKATDKMMKSTEPSKLSGKGGGAPTGKPTRGDSDAPAVAMKRGGRVSGSSMKTSMPRSSKAAGCC